MKKTQLFRLIFSCVLGLGLLCPPALRAFLDLDHLAQDFVLEMKKINVPGYPGVFNPSIVRWKGGTLMSFRVLTHPWNLWHSQIGIVWVDENFEVIGTPQLLNTRAHIPHIASRSEDARLFTVGDRLYVIYNDSEEPDDGWTRRMYVAEITYDGAHFEASQPECMAHYEGEEYWKWDKNWAPFDYHGTMLLTYSISPHRIFLPLAGTRSCQTVATTDGIINWPWGGLKGGTPPLLMGDEYLGFCHSWTGLTTVQSGNTYSYHYLVGAYTFEPHPPFTITKFSPLPIVGRGLYDNPLLYKRVIFPGGYIFDDQHIWIAYGREDCECWVLKLDRQGLLSSLVPVDPKE